MSYSFPTSGGGANGSYASSHDDLNMKIEIPKVKDEKHPHKHHHQQQHHQQQQQYQQQVAPTAATHHHYPLNHVNGNTPLLSPHQIAPHHDIAHIPSRGSSILANTAPVHTLHHHPRQPTAAADSYFPNSASGVGGNHLVHSSNSQPPRTPGSLRSHSRQTSGAAAIGGINSAIFPPRSTKHSNQSMSLSLSTGGGAGGGNQSQADFANYSGPNHAGPPSPSTLTDIILGLYSTLYGGKRTSEEVRDRVAMFYDQDASE